MPGAPGVSELVGLGLPGAPGGIAPGSDGSASEVTPGRDESAPEPGCHGFTDSEATPQPDSNAVPTTKALASKITVYLCGTNSDRLTTKCEASANMCWGSKPSELLDPNLEFRSYSSSRGLAIRRVSSLPGPVNGRDDDAAARHEPTPEPRCEGNLAVWQSGGSRGPNLSHPLSALRAVMLR